MLSKIPGAVLFMLLLGCNTSGQTNNTASLLVLNKGDNNMAIVNPATLQVVATVPVGDGPHEMTVSADGKLAFTANYGSKEPGHSLSVIDIAAKKEIRRVELGPVLKPHGITEKNGKVYFIAEFSRIVGRYDFAAGKLDWITGTGQDGGHMLVLTPDGNKIYTANRVSNTVTFIDLNTSMPVGGMLRIPVGKRPEGIAVSPDGKEVWVGNTGEGTISIIDVATNTVKQTFTVGKVPIRICFTPDGKRVLVSDNGTDELIVLEAATRKIIKRMEAKGSPVGIIVTPDGSKAFIARSGAGMVSAVDLGSLSVTGDIKMGSQPDGMAWVE